MPLKPGKSKKVISSNIEELLAAFAAKGSIGTSGPISKSKAKRMAIAISYNKARKNKGK